MWMSSIRVFQEISDFLWRYKIYNKKLKKHIKFKINPVIPIRIPTDCEIPYLNIADEYDIEKTIAEGYFAKIFLTTHRPTKSCIALKACHAELTSIKDFIKEFHYNYQLSHHTGILSCYQVKIEDIVR